MAVKKQDSNNEPWGKMGQLPVHKTLVVTVSGRGFQPGIDASLILLNIVVISVS